MKLKQRNIPWLGAFTESVYTVLPALSILNFFMIGIAVYEGVARFVTPYLPWFSFRWFVLMVGTLVIIGTVFVYLFVVPSRNTFMFNQMNKFESPVLEEIRKLRTDLVRAGVNISTDHEDSETATKAVEAAPRQ